MTVVRLIWVTKVLDEYCTMAQLKTLPEELLMLIFQHLDAIVSDKNSIFSVCQPYKGLKRYKEVNEHWRHVIEEMFKLTSRAGRR